MLEVTVTDEDGTVQARGQELKRTAEGPLSVLVRPGDEITLEDRWQVGFYNHT